MLILPSFNRNACVFGGGSNPYSLMNTSQISNVFNCLIHSFCQVSLVDKLAYGVKTKKIGIEKQKRLMEDQRGGPFCGIPQTRRGFQHGIFMQGEFVSDWTFVLEKIITP